MKFFERIGKKTPKKNRIIGQVATGLFGIALTIAESGVIDNRPILKIAIQVISAKMGVIAVYNAQKVEEDGPVDNQ